MRIAITGSTGFIGSHVLTNAISCGHMVRAFCGKNNLVASGLMSLSPEWHSCNIQTISAADLDGIDAVIHLACVGVSPRQASWNKLFEVNVLGSLNLIKAAKSAGVRRIVVAGTCHEYGLAANDYDKIPPEAALIPTSAYGLSKALSFLVVHGFAREHQLELFYGRVFTAYGNGQHRDNFWPSLKRAATAGIDFAMTSGRQVSDFIPVSKVASHLVNACSRPDIEAGFPLVTNIGTGIGCSLLDFALREWKQMNARGQIVPNILPDRPDQVYRYVADLAGLVPAKNNT